MYEIYSQDYIPPKIFTMIYQLTWDYLFQTFQKGLIHAMCGNGPLHQVECESWWQVDRLNHVFTPVLRVTCANMLRHIVFPKWWVQLCPSSFEAKQAFCRYISRWCSNQVFGSRAHHERMFVGTSSGGSSEGLALFQQDHAWTGCLVLSPESTQIFRCNLLQSSINKAQISVKCWHTCSNLDGSEIALTTSYQAECAHPCVCS